MQLQTDQIRKRLTSLIEATQKLIGMTEPEELLQHILESALLSDEAISRNTKIALLRSQ